MLLLLLLALPVFAEDGFVIVGARVFDGETIRDNVTVVVQGDRITAVIENTPFNPKPGRRRVPRGSARPRWPPSGRCAR